MRTADAPVNDLDTITGMAALYTIILMWRLAGERR
jgi:hypothetical protein